MKWLSRLYLTIVYLLMFSPIAVMVIFSFNASKVGYQWGGFSTHWYSELFSNAAMVQAAINSVILAVVAATISTAIGGLTALALQRYDFKGKSILQSLLFVLMMSPEIVLAISLLALFLIVGIQLGFVTLLIAHITFCLPFVVITV
ncbi:MAG: spermidine/putrescine ABC transporter permease PotC, partial [Moraxella osloensis]|nr:spermidine/putrescine ABC transporter permease PotC [Moraxella osloensis]